MGNVQAIKCFTPQNIWRVKEVMGALYNKCVCCHMGMHDDVGHCMTGNGNGMSIMIQDTSNYNLKMRSKRMGSTETSNGSK